MSILFNIGHPAQVHLFKNVVKKLENKGYNCILTVIDKDVSTKLLDNLGYDYYIVGRGKKGLVNKSLEMFAIEKELINLTIKLKPKLLVGGVGNVYVTHVGKITRLPSIVFDDTEHSRYEHMLLDPFATKIITPQCYYKNLGKKQIRYNGYHEIAYLHPNYYKPDKTILELLNIDPSNPFLILRLVSWTASHDQNQFGIKDLTNLVKYLENNFRVIISSEIKLNKFLESYVEKINPLYLHDLLYYSTLNIGEGAKTAAEGAVLGTHSIYINTLKLGYIEDISKRYNLISIIDPRQNNKQILNRIDSIIQNTNFNKDAKGKRDLLIKEHIDVTNFIFNYLLNYN